MLNPHDWNKYLAKYIETLNSLVNMPGLKKSLQAPDAYLKLQVTTSNDDVPHFELKVFGSKSIIEWKDSSKAKEFFNINKGLNEPPPEIITKIVTDQPLLTIFRISFQYYPHCCAFVQANGFYYSETYGTKELCYFLMDTLSKEMVKNLSAWSRRLMFNFVELGHDRIKEQCNFTKSKDRFLAEIPATEAPKMQYHHIWDWAKEQYAFRELVNYNENSGNIVHTVTVVPKVNF